MKKYKKTINQNGEGSRGGERIAQAHVAYHNCSRPSSGDVLGHTEDTERVMVVGTVAEPVEAYCDRASPDIPRAEDLKEDGHDAVDTQVAVVLVVAVGGGDDDRRAMEPVDILAKADPMEEAVLAGEDNTFGHGVGGEEISIPSARVTLLLLGRTAQPRRRKEDEQRRRRWRCCFPGASGISCAVGAPL